MDDILHIKLLNILTKHDEAERKKKYFNPYAFGHYCKALNNCQQHMNSGAELRIALLNCFNGRLLDKLLKATDLPPSTKEEKLGQYKKLHELD